MPTKTPAQKIWMSLVNADEKNSQAATVDTSDRAGRAYKKYLANLAKSMRERFPDRLRKQREKQGLTQKELAEWADLTPNAVALIERGERSPSLDTAARLCWALDMAGSK